MGLGWTGRVMQLLQGACTLVLVNLLFAAGVVVGLGIVGVMPASVAAATVLLPGKSGKSGESGESGEIGTARRFVRAYRESFVRANLTGIPFLIAGVLLAADAAVLPRLGGPVAAALTALTTVVGLVVLLTFIVCVTLLVRYRDTPAAVLRYALTLPLTAPLTGAGVLLVLIAFAVIASVVPVVVPLVGASLPLVLATHLIDHRLATIDARHPASAGVPH